MSQRHAMPPPPDRPGLASLRRQIGLLERGVSHPGMTVIRWGIPGIDQHLPAGGLEPGALHEFAGADLEEAGLAAGIVLRLAGRAQKVRPGHVLWVARQRDLYARALPRDGCDPTRLVHLLTRRNEDTLWALEEALRVPGLGLLIGEVGPLDLTQSRRLQLAAEKSGVPAFIIRRGRNAAQARRWLAQPITAQTRWRIQPAPSVAEQPGLPGSRLPGPMRWQIELMRCRNGQPGTWLLEETDHGWREATLSLPVPAALADRPLVAPSDAGRKRKAS